MHNGVPVELVRTNTGDGLRLDGAWYAPAMGVSSVPRAVLCLHGAGSNFYGAGLWERMVGPVTEAGWGMLRVNTRGHDGYFAARTAIGAVRLGAAYERVSDCTLDIAAWLDWLNQSGIDSVVLIGHSLGAVKAIYSLSQTADHRVAGLIAISPPRLSYSAFRASPKSHEFMPTVRAAQQHVHDGHPHAVLESTFPFPMLITAEAYLDKYGAEKYNIVELVGRLTTPSTFVYGQLELEQGGVAFAGLPEALQRTKREDQRLDVRIVSDADHFYVGRYEALHEVTVAALRGLE